VDVPEIDLDRQLVALARLLIGHRADEIEGLAEMPERLGAGGGRRLLMQPELAVYGADFRRLDQPRVRHGHRMQRAFQFFEPENEEFVQLWEYRA
jgi:hypothetical protein